VLRSCAKWQSNACLPGVAGLTNGFDNCPIRSRAEQLRLRGQRNYDRYMLVTKKFVAADSPERAAWQKESAQESLRDTEWTERHGPVPGGATILQWREDDAAGRIAPEQSVS
jgi:hypothetical protein